MNLHAYVRMCAFIEVWIRQLLFEHISRVVIMIQGMSWNSDLTERNDLTLEKISWHGTDDLGLSHLDPTLTDILNHPIYIIIITNHHHHHHHHQSSLSSSPPPLSSVSLSTIILSLINHQHLETDDLNFLRFTDILTCPIYHLVTSTHCLHQIWKSILSWK